MTIARLISKYEIEDADVDIIHNELLLPDGTLENCFKKLNEKIDKRKIFNIAKSLATSEYNCDISELNYNFVDERNELDSEKLSLSQGIREDKEIGRYLANIKDEVIVSKMEKKLEELV